MPFFIGKNYVTMNKIIEVFIMMYFFFSLLFFSLIGLLGAIGFGLNAYKNYIKWKHPLSSDSTKIASEFNCQMSSLLTFIFFVMFVMSFFPAVAMNIAKNLI